MRTARETSPSAGVDSSSQRRSIGADGTAADLEATPSTAWTVPAVLTWYPGRGPERHAACCQGLEVRLKTVLRAFVLKRVANGFAHPSSGVQLETDGLQAVAQLAGRRRLPAGGDPQASPLPSAGGMRPSPSSTPSRTSPVGTRSAATLHRPRTLNEGPGEGQHIPFGASTPRRRSDRQARSGRRARAPAPATLARRRTAHLSRLYRTSSDGRRPADEARRRARGDSANRGRARRLPASGGRCTTAAARTFGRPALRLFDRLGDLASAISDVTLWVCVYQHHAASRARYNRASRRQAEEQNGRH